MSGNLLAKWIIGKAEKSEAYRAGTLTGMKHPKPDREMIKAAGGLPELIRQADELEKSGYIRKEKPPFVSASRFLPDIRYGWMCSI